MLHVIQLNSVGAEPATIKKVKLMLTILVTHRQRSDA